MSNENDKQQKKTVFQKKVSPESFLRAFPVPQRPANADDTAEFQIVPSMLSGTSLLPPAGSKRWRIVLSPVERPLEQMALELVGDAVLGSSAEQNPEMDINLAAWQGAERGVSYRHALLRPAKEKLYLIDLGSTNGTHYNGSLLTTERVQAVQQGDLITFGRLHLRVKHLSQFEAAGKEQPANDSGSKAQDSELKTQDSKGT